MGQNIVSLNWQKDRSVVKRASGRSTKTLKNKEQTPTLYLNKISTQKPMATKPEQDLDGLF